VHGPATRTYQTRPIKERIDDGQEDLRTALPTDRPGDARGSGRGVGSGERHHRRERLHLHGSQEDRGYIWIINEASGEGTLSMVTDTTVISLFTVCAATDDVD